MTAPFEMTPEVISSARPALVIMAAGAGSRYGGAKQTDAIGPHGEWLLEFGLFDALRAGFGRVVLILREELEPEFRQRLARMRAGIDAHLIVQRTSDVPGRFRGVNRTRPWGTGHAVLTARHVVGDASFAVMNADDFYGPEAFRLAEAACRLAHAEGVATVVGMRLDRTLSPHGPVKRAWCQTAGAGRVTRLEEVMGLEDRAGRLAGSGPHASLSFDGSELVSMNFWVFPPAIFRQLGLRFAAFVRRHANDAPAEFLLPEVVNELIEAGGLALRAVEAPGPWFGLTYRGDRAAVEAGLRELTERGVYPEPLWGTV